MTALPASATTVAQLFHAVIHVSVYPHSTFAIVRSDAETITADYINWGVSAAFIPAVLTFVLIAFYAIIHIGWMCCRGRRCCQSCSGCPLPKPVPKPKSGSFRIRHPLSTCYEASAITMWVVVSMIIVQLMVFYYLLKSAMTDMDTTVHAVQATQTALLQDAVRLVDDTTACLATTDRVVTLLNATNSTFGLRFDASGSRDAMSVALTAASFIESAIDQNLYLDTARSWIGQISTYVIRGGAGIATVLFLLTFTSGGTVLLGCCCRDTKHDARCLNATEVLSAAALLILVFPSTLVYFSTGVPIGDACVARDDIIASFINSDAINYYVKCDGTIPSPIDDQFNTSLIQIASIATTIQSVAAFASQVNSSALAAECVGWESNRTQIATVVGQIRAGFLCGDVHALFESASAALCGSLLLAWFGLMIAGFACVLVLGQFCLYMRRPRWAESPSKPPPSGGTELTPLLSKKGAAAAAAATAIAASAAGFGRGRERPLDKQGPNSRSHSRPRRKRRRSHRRAFYSDTDV